MTNEELVKEYQSGNKEVLQDIINNNEKMIRKLVSKFYTSKINSLDEEDLFQEGCIGLMKACEKYNIDKESSIKFINYAVYWIYKMIYASIHKNNTNEEISLNAKSGNDEEELGSKIISEEDYFVKAEDSMYYKNVREELGYALDKELNINEKTIVKLHYGWDSGQLSIKELARTYNVDINEIIKINKTSLNKLRKSAWGRREYINRRYYLKATL